MIANNKTMGEHGLYADPETGEESITNLDIWPYHSDLVTEAQESNYVTNSPDYKFSPTWDPKPCTEHESVQQLLEAFEQS